MIYAEYQEEEQLFDIYENGKYIQSLEISLKDLELLEKAGMIIINKHYFN